MLRDYGSFLADGQESADNSSGGSHKKIFDGSRDSILPLSEK